MMTVLSASTQDLVLEMKKLAKIREMDQRKKVYIAFLVADLLVPLKTTSVPPTVSDCELEDFAADGELGGKPSVVVFTSQAACLKWSDTYQNKLVCKGAELVVHLRKVGAGSLKINPQGSVGGEFYGNEVQTLADAAIRMRLVGSPS